MVEQKRAMELLLLSRLQPEAGKQRTAGSASGAAAAAPATAAGAASDGGSTTATGGSDGKGGRGGREGDGEEAVRMAHMAWEALASVGHCLDGLQRAVNGRWVHHPCRRIVWRPFPPPTPPAHPPAAVIPPLLGLPYSHT